jgi:hypothetical protein
MNSPPIGEQMNHIFSSCCVNRSWALSSNYDFFARDCAKIDAKLAKFARFCAFLPRFLEALAKRN